MLTHHTWLVGAAMSCSASSTVDKAWEMLLHSVSSISSRWDPASPLHGERLSTRADRHPSEPRMARTSPPRLALATPTNAKVVGTSCGTILAMAAA
jgi:hypothetical protein